MTLVVNNVTLKIAGSTLVENLGFQVKPGEIMAIMGASGCGKSSLLNFIAGTLDRSFQRSGSVLLNEEDITKKSAYKRRIGLQYQDHLLFPHMTIAENLAFGLPAKYRRKERIKRVEKALSDCGMKSFTNKNPATLSGGQKARISLMRTLLSEPAALLLDEPFSKLDPELKASFRSFVFEQVISRAIPTVVVTHDQQDVYRVSDIVRF